MRVAPPTHSIKLERSRRRADSMMPYDRTHDVTTRNRLVTNFMISVQLKLHILLSSTSSVTDEDHFWEWRVMFDCGLAMFI